MGRFFRNHVPIIIIVLTVFLSHNAFSWQRPKLSPKASVMQTIKTTEVTVVYHRPFVEPPPGAQRTTNVIWGDTVPFGEVWRAGANEATTIEFSTDVIVEGHPLSKGIYGFWTIPEKDEWTHIFSKAHDVWGIPYPEGQDVLRVTVTPRTAEHMESHQFFFNNITAESAVLNLHWEKVLVPMHIKVK